MWHVDISQRYTIDQVLEHPWVTRAELCTSLEFKQEMIIRFNVPKNETLAGNKTTLTGII